MIVFIYFIDGIYLKNCILHPEALAHNRRKINNIMTSPQHVTKRVEDTIIKDNQNFIIPCLAEMSSRSSPE